MGLALAVMALIVAVAGLQAGSAAALTPTANCALSGSSFQGGDGDQDTPTLAEQAFCTEHLLPTSTDWPFHLTHWHIVISLGDRSLKAYFNGRLRFTAPVGVGKPSTPTPTGRFWIRERFKLANPNDPYGPWALGTSAYSRLTDWPGGGVVGIHGDFGEPRAIPGDPSHGCVRLRRGDLAARAADRSRHPRHDHPVGRAGRCGHQIAAIGTTFQALLPQISIDHSRARAIARREDAETCGKVSKRSQPGRTGDLLLAHRPLRGVNINRDRAASHPW